MPTPSKRMMRVKCPAKTNRCPPECLHYENHKDEGLCTDTFCDIPEIELTCIPVKRRKK